MTRAPEAFGRWAFAAMRDRTVMDEDLAALIEGLRSQSATSSGGRAHGR